MGARVDVQEADLRTSTPPGSPRTRHVTQLDGLRGIAVAAILLFHLGTAPFRSGFLGVDIFFVISGFLITSLLLAEVDRTGRISLSNFWARRVRRLLPALVVFLLVIAAVGALTATATERRSLRGDLLATSAYVANWHLIGTSRYFTNDGIESPLEHTWSLAIEEQFYLVWPLVVAGILVWMRGRARTLGLFALAIAMLSAGLLFIEWHRGASVERAYMGTDGRVFEPLIGALGAIVVTSVWAKRAVPTHARWIAPIAAALVTLGLITITAGGGYSSWGAVGLSLATVVLIAVVWSAPDAGPVGRGLSWKPLVWIGTISYGVYLWHWPVYLWLGVRDPSASVQRRLVAIALTIAIAAASYVLIERPIRRGTSWASAGWTRAWLGRSRNILIAMPLLLAFVACASVRATTVPPPTDADFVIMMTGDSVPRQIIPGLEAASQDRGWRYADATRGGCPVTGDEPVDPNGVGWTTEGDCRLSVVQKQDTLLASTHPDVVIWWDRASLSNFVGEDGVVVLGGSDAFWRIRAQRLDDTVQRLSAGGAIVILMATEPPGVNLDPGAWGEYQIQHYPDITMRWDDMLRDYAAAHPKTTRFLDLRPIVCPANTAPCDDMVNGVRAREDGQHYIGPGQAVVVPTIISAIEQAAAAGGKTAP